jgi:hypothetical protein
MMNNFTYPFVTLKAFFVKATLTLMLLSMIGSCTSYQQFQYLSEEYEIPAQVFDADYTQTWQAVLQEMKKYNLSLQNQEAGVIKTRWTDNTLELNFADSFGTGDAVKAAKFMIIVNVVKGFRGNREVCKVTVFRRQMVEQDFLQGYKVIPSDGILENTILYRIGRNIQIENQLKVIEEKRQKEQEMAF